MGNEEWQITSLWFACPIVRVDFECQRQKINQDCERARQKQKVVMNCRRAWIVGIQVLMGGERIKSIIHMYIQHARYAYMYRYIYPCVYMCVWVWVCVCAEDCTSRNEFAQHGLLMTQSIVPFIFRNYSFNYLFGLGEHLHTTVVGQVTTRTMAMASFTT